MLDVLVRPFAAFFDPGERIYWPCLLGTAAMAITLTWWLGRNQAPALRVRNLRDRSVWLGPSARVDYQLIMFNGVLRGLVALPWAAVTLDLARAIAVGLTRALGNPGWMRGTQISSGAVIVLYSMTLFVVWDLSRFLLHRWMHTVPALWEIHKVHHSADTMTPFTFYRAHPLEALLFDIRGALVTGILAGVFFHAFGYRAVQWEVLGVSGLGFVMNLAGANLRHSHVWLSYGPFVEKLFISPAQHQIHHSVDPGHYNKNFGTWLATWDRLAGTLLLAGKPAGLRFGLPHADRNHDPYSAVSALAGPVAALVRKNWLAGGPGPGKYAVIIFLALSAAAVRSAWAQEASASPPPTSVPPPDAVPEGGQAPQLDEGEVYVIDPDIPSGSQENPPPPPALTQPASDSETRKSPGGSTASAPSPATAEVPAAPAPPAAPGRGVDVVVDTVSIIATPEAVSRVTGSAHQLGEKELERFGSDDVHRVLVRIPGVYVRGEEGHGLRPNIGLRGVNSDRSAKVVLMEDGVMIAPAPYSAPAAYYFPLMTRIAGLEVFKGPAAIRFGPHTIGGALNLQTRPIPQTATGYLDLAYGRFRTGRMHAYGGGSTDHFGALFEGAHLGTAGFKQLDDGGDTGFERNDVAARFRVNTDPTRALFQQLELRLGYGDEVSNETYLGLSESDFANTPYRRYPSTRLDRMAWDRTHVRLDYFIARDDALDFQLTLYRNDFHRAWRKLNRFRSGADLRGILHNHEAGQAAVYYAVLRGEEDAQVSDQALMIGINDRTFVSEGAAAVAHWRPVLGPVTQDIELGARFHFDSIERDHTEDAFMMTRGALVPEGSETITTVKNKAATRAIALHLHDQVGIGELTLAPGLRVEIIDGRLEDRLTNRTSDNSDVVILPGAGVHYFATPWLGVLLGVHKGFSPVSPGQPEGVLPEQAVNWEGGARVNLPTTSAEAIVFFSDYSNLTAECTFSAGCSEELLNRQFNGGAAFVYGLESLFRQSLQAPFGLGLRLDAICTLTMTRLRSSFGAQDPMLGKVEKGDELPYIPKHQAVFTVGVERLPWSLDVSATYVGEQRDLAGQGSIPAAERIPGYAVVDLGTRWQVGRGLQIYAIINNLLNHEYMVSRRPFGPRPGAPFQLMAGASMLLERAPPAAAE